ncbi:sensor domain-containing diguanylate cyclase [Psychrobacter sp. P11G3]|uniref:GGDEF domain-containing protein n=1 Tax=Psychrobacter sp. P11G3 TaxID=1699623 RepID=UPI0009EC9B3B|nr:GGDEF domain-containing protein [Psychrobacter sp. P11G3]
MAVYKFYLGHRELSKAVFEWEAADRTALLAAFMMMEVFSHWLWCLFVWYRRDTYSVYIDINLLYLVWISVSIVVVFLLWMSSRFSPVRSISSNLNIWQALLITIYSVYITFIVTILGHSSLVTGVSLVGGAMLGMMLVNRNYVWRAFIGQIIAILAVSLLPHFGITIPNLRQLTATTLPPSIHSYMTYSDMTIIKNEALTWEGLNHLRQSSNLLWRSTHIYMSLPKAIFIIYMFRILLVSLDDSRRETLRHANQDELTQLKNRRYGLKKMKYALATVREYQDLSVMLLDLDWFKQINDNYGHDVGDQVLIEISQTLAQSLTDESIISRYGGEEFLIVLPDTKHDSAMMIAEQLRLNIAEHVMKIEGLADFNVTASFGLYTLTHEERDCIVQGYEKITQQKTVARTSPLIKPIATQRAESQIASIQKLPSDICQRLISTADKALYEAKHRGRNQVVSANEMWAEKKGGKQSLYKSR